VLAQSLLGLLRWEHSLKLSDGFPDFRLIGGIVKEGLAEETTTVLEDARCEVAVLVPSICWSTESSFKRKTVDEVELTPHHNSCCRLTGLLNDKVASIKAEVLRILTEKQWIDTLL